MMLVELKNISMNYGKGANTVHALRNVHFRMEKGDFLAVTGKSGSGKSTLLRLISGVLTPDSGEIKVFGLKEIPGWAQLSFVPQDSLLLPWRTVLDNIMLPLELNKK